jgi:hypothetical protein
MERRMIAHLRDYTLLTSIPLQAIGMQRLNSRIERLHVVSDFWKGFRRFEQSRPLVEMSDREPEEVEILVCGTVCICVVQVTMHVGDVVESHGECRKPFPHQVALREHITELQGDHGAGGIVGHLFSHFREATSNTVPFRAFERLSLSPRPRERRSRRPGRVRSAVPDWQIGQTFVASTGQLFRILAIEPEMDEERSQETMGAVGRRADR